MTQLLMLREMPLLKQPIYWENYHWQDQIDENEATRSHALWFLILNFNINNNQ